MVLVSNDVASNQSGIFTVFGKVNTVTVLPEVNRTSHIPDTHGVNDKLVTSPQIYLVFYSAVITGDVPDILVTTVPLQFSVIVPLE